jgi:signal transduction histidine kinase
MRDYSDNSRTRNDIASSTSLPYLLQLGQQEYLKEIMRVDRHFRLNAYFVTVLWLLLILICYKVTPEENFEVLEGPELYSALFACTFLGLSLLARFSTVFWLESQGRTGISGVLVAALTVQIIAMLNSGLMSCGIPIPVMNDPILGNRIYLLRWCEWAPLGFYMTFVVVGIDASTTLRQGYIIGASQGVSALAGIVFPFCRNFPESATVTAFSVFLYLLMFPIIYRQKQRFAKMSRTNSAHSMELWHRARLSYQLMVTCTVARTFVVTMYFFAGISVYLRPEGVESDELWVFQRPYFSMIWECVMDVIVKNLYMNVIVQVHKVAFDDGERAERRLGELRRLMSAVWESSSDVICVSVQGISGTITTMVSPVYLRLYHNKVPTPRAILLEIDQGEIARQDYPNIQARNVREIDFRSFPTPGSQIFNDDTDIGTATTTLDKSLLTSLAGMIARGWNSRGDRKSLAHKLLKDFDTEKRFISCEANICYLENDAMLMVIRDISERSKRFEAEKKMILETTARKKDAEANRFTRHEVKNGLLAAIDLCESLKESTFSQEGTEHDSQNVSVAENASLAALSATSEDVGAKNNISTYTKELDKTLKTILDTILSEAMARDVIHGNYEPKMERVDIEKLLQYADKIDERFRLIVTPSPLPSLYFDPQLLLYIHRNAVSNACKYGQIDGIVTTITHYDESRELLQMEVENLPGPEHHRLLSLGPGAGDMVFESGRRLHDDDDDSSRDRPSSHSAGDGAWIMRKCAETLKGKARIRFERERTVFSLTCPAKRFGKGGIKSEIFQIPQNAWGVAIDDSKIQRKLLSKFLSHAGVPESRQIIQGATGDEIRAFDSFLVDLVQKHPNDYILVIVDENLDITENGTLSCTTVSGSECIRRVRQQLLPEQERRVLCLVRSANDSSEDIAIYNSRAHGFVSKAPVRSSSVVETIAPLWEKRFNHIPAAAEVVSSTALPTSGSDPQALNDFANLVEKELLANLDFVDELCSEESHASLEQNWHFVWEKLHCLKGDLLSLFNKPSIQEAVKDINLMSGPELPSNFEARWIALRSQISDIAYAIGSNKLLQDAEGTIRGCKRSNSGSTLSENLNKKPRAQPRRAAKSP